MDHHGGRSPKSGEAAREAFRALVPDGPRVSVRPMFGSVAAFAEGQMFMGLFADELFVRLAEPDRAAVLSAGGHLLEPMPGRPMREYVSLPDWSSDSGSVRHLGAQALAYALTLPPKKR
jgi:TfoX/Sxy family transcriptional regulator of competence genes